MWRMLPACGFYLATWKRINVASWEHIPPIYRTILLPSSAEFVGSFRDPHSI